MNASPPIGLVEAPPLLEVTGLRKAYGDGGFFSRRRHHALDDVSLTLRASDGRVLSIVGESGSGKTTLARVILRLVTADAGEVRVEGHPIVSRGNPVVDQRTLRHLVQPIFQNPFETFSLHLPVDSYLFRTAANLQSAHTRTDLESAVSEALEAVGLTYSKVAGRGIRAFSGGELQRIAIARALIAKPRLIVADEPVSMVDASLRTTIVNLFKELASKLDVAFVYITHDLSTAYYLSDLMAIMKSGKLVDFGRPDAIIDNPNADYTRALIDAIPTLGRKWAI
jgi:ABC-type oligopeptide transport system ATPase subunit